MTEKACPDQQVLEKLLLGRVAAEEAVSLEQHLSGCDLCAERAGEMTSNDELIDAMQAKQFPPLDEQRVTELIDRMRDVAADAETSRLGDTLPATVGQNAMAMRELSEFLDPPQQADEIGRIGGYRVLDVLGVGGMGIVLRAEDSNLKRPVAIKVMKGDVAEDASARSRFLREARTTAAIEHDNIVTIYQVAEHHGMPYYTMQFLRGESLEDRLKRVGALDQSEVLRIGREIAKGLVAAHAQGLLHRDIKPDNVWLEEQSDRAKIVDFGLARDVRDDQNVTMTGVVLGTPRYMAPEQALGKPVDGRCDLFSLGCVMYHLATGRPPFAGENLAATLMAVINEQPQPITQSQPNLDPELAQIIDRLLAKDPAARFQAADELVAAIGRIEQRLIDQKRRENEQRRSQPTPAELYLRSQRRRRVMIGTALVAGLLAIVFGVILFIQTQTGTVRVEVNDDNLEVLIDGQKITLTDKKGKQRKRTSKHRLAIKLGDQTLNIGEATVLKVDGRDVEHHLTVKLNGFDITSNEFEVVRGDSTVLTISFERRPSTPSATIDPNAPPLAIAPFNEIVAKKHQQAWSDYLGLPIEKEVELPSGEKVAFQLIPPGEFMMGSSEEEQARFLTEATAAKDEWSKARIPHEGPQHRVRLTEPFYLGKYEVTQAQWQAMMSANPSHFNDNPENPVELVSWGDIRLYLAALNKDALVEDMKFALPTEAQWEFACRAGTTTVWHSGPNDADVWEYGWIGGNSGGKTHPVGQMRPNAFGLYDMHGNVWEWCADRFAPDYYENAPAENPIGPAFAGHRVARGGSWYYAIRFCRSALRYYNVPDHRLSNLGFRLAMTIDASKLISASPTIADPDLRAAQWVQSINTHHFTYIVIRQNGVERRINHEELKSERALPTEPFELTGVFLQYNRDLTDEGLVNLRDCQHLTLVNFTYTGVGDAGLAHLQACCPNLLELHLPGGVTDAGLANFKECRELRRLTLHGVRTSTAGLDNFRNCRKLTSLSLGGVKLAGHSLESFAGCVELEHLSLKNCGLNSGELVHFKDCRNLKQIDLSGNPAITNKDLGHLQNCLELTGLDLTDANVDDEGLAFLLNCQRLTGLGVGGTNVSEAFLESLQAKLPNCKIIWDGRSSVDQAKLTPTEILTSPDWKWTEPEPITEINSEAFDGFPTISGDGLTMVFASSREGGQSDGYDLWISERALITDPWGEPQNLGPEVNSSGFDETPELSHNGLKLIFAQSKPGTRSGDLFVTSRAGRGARWSNAVVLEGPINTSADEQSPSLSEDGLTLMFCSNRPGGIPHRNTPAFAYDLWVSRRDALDAPWKQPTNLGPSINTPNIEKGCCLSSDGLTLLFCNDDLKRTTRSDRYMAHRKSSDEPWSKPVRLPEIFQADSQDTDIELSSDGREVYVELDSDIYVIRRVPK